MKSIFYALVLAAIPATAMAGGHAESTTLVDLTNTFYGYLSIALFIGAYSVVPFENKFHLRKSKPVILAAGVIWILVALAYMQIGDTHTAHEAIRESLLEYAELFLFLLVAMTYINSLEERYVFLRLRAILVSKGFSLVKIYWITGLLAFFISPVADNLTTALLMGAVVIAVGGKNQQFVIIACINIVVAANAGGAFSPFGDITTLMVWQKGKVQFIEFFDLFLPSLVNWLVPAIIMMFAIGKAKPESGDIDVEMRYGAIPMIGLFLLTITTAVCFHNFLHLPASAGMMLGMGYLGFFSYHIKRAEGRHLRYDPILGVRNPVPFNPKYATSRRNKSIDEIMQKIPHPAFAIDLERKVTHWNRHIENLTGVAAADRIGTDKYWSPFRDNKQKVLVDMVMDSAPPQEYEKLYHGKHHESSEIYSGHEAAQFFPNIGPEGKNLVMTAAPIRDKNGHVIGGLEIIREVEKFSSERSHFDLMRRIARAEWDTLLFFYGVILCVGGLSQFGYMGHISQVMYADLGPTVANSLVGMLSAIVDNIPVMFAVLTMDPAMSHGQWLLVTLTAGVGGSLLSIGSAAGVALMGTARGVYTFANHLKWTPVIALGYIASILMHLWFNSSLMHVFQ